MRHVGEHARIIDNIAAIGIDHHRGVLNPAGIAYVGAGDDDRAREHLELHPIVAPSCPDLAGIGKRSPRRDHRAHHHAEPPVRVVPDERAHQVASQQFRRPVDNHILDLLDVEIERDAIGRNGVANRWIS